MELYLIFDVFFIGVALEKPTSEQLLDIANLTNCNPLLISLLLKLVSDYGGWCELDDEEMKKIVEEDKDFGLIYYFTKRVASHSQIENIWKLIIPRVLTIEIENLLFDGKDVFELLVNEGLLHRGKGKERNLYTIHDDVIMAITSHAKKEFDSLSLASWHDRVEVRELHHRLKEFYGTGGEIYGFEECYHKIMLRNGFEERFEVTREKFAFYSLSHFSWSYKDKIEHCQNFNKLSDDGIANKIKKFKEDEEFYRFIMSPELYNEMSNNLFCGNLNQGIYDVDYFLNLSKKKKFEKDSSVYCYLGFSYDYRKEYDKAIEFYKKTIEINPKNGWAYYNMGKSYSNKKEYDKAIESYGKAIDINPKDDESYRNMGVIYEDKKEYDKAIKLYQKAININPEFAEVYYNMGVTYVNKKEYDNAIEMYKKAVGINPKYDVAYYNMGFAYNSKKEYKKAIEMYEKAIEINPQYDKAYNNMGIAYCFLGEFDMPIVSMALNINPNNIQLIKMLIEVRLKTKHLTH